MSCFWPECKLGYINSNLLVDMDTNTFPEIVLFSRAGCSINGTPWRPLPQLRLLPGKVATRQPGNSVSGRAFRLPVSRLHGRWHESSWRWRWGHAEASSAQTQGSVIPRAPGRPPGRPFTHSLFERRARRRERAFLVSRITSGPVRDGRTTVGATTSADRAPLGNFPQCRPATVSSAERRAGRYRGWRGAGRRPR